ncbi:hypothetical protein [Streptacidiphilus jiangxiensis]|uniref:Copper resistance protein D n=1 Tax=Streptacidiphilus jiangxiensis TaxID=235985 RepID=A0A1H7UPQ2_STRJI|nr:hypothetical protein [Streptacidiphilus jiangxiensis]SEL98618.1 hypothetical protein SAMN05414137_11675 [Streptacidiphilus jiangxiensis]
MSAASHLQARPADRRQQTLWRIAAVCLGWYAVILASVHTHPGFGVREVALGVHLVSLTLGFGAVLAVDGLGLAVLAGRARVGALLAFSARAERLIWTGFVGLALSGIALRPDFASGWTDANLVAALVAAVNGVLAQALRSGVPDVERLSGWRELPAPLLWRAGAAALVSQAAWWTSILIGALTG